jgi:putative sigma-54 modulation protein
MDGKIEVFAKNMEVTDRINEYVTKKVSKLEKFMTGVDDTRVDLVYEKSARNAADRQVAQITVRGKRAVLRTEEKANDIFEAIDAAVDKMQRKMERYKGKRMRGRGNGSSAAEVAAEPLPETEAEGSPIIAKRKSFHLVPMDELEAVEQMQLLGHENFFVFYNINTNSINVIYKRHDGTYGLISPELA